MEQAVLPDFGGGVLCEHHDRVRVQAPGGSTRWHTRLRSLSKQQQLNRPVFGVCRESQFERPGGPSGEGLPANWVEMVSRTTGEVYYSNTLTGESSFDRPTGTADDDDATVSPCPPHNSNVDCM